jgi:hypothetical protein
MPDPSEPEKYSIDEMMDRLKRPAESTVEDGELVTRADGSQAIRVRKKKRRSHQPHKEERRQQMRARMLQVSGVLILLLLALFGAGVAIVYANSAPFREDLARKIALSSGAEVELRQFRMNPSTANASELILTWPQGNALGNLSLRGLKASISPISFLGKTMIGEEASAAEGTLTLNIPQPDQALRAVPPPSGTEPIRFDQYVIAKFHALAGDPASPRIRLRNSEATLVPLDSAAPPQLRLTRGEILANGWPKLRMDRSHIEFRGREVDIVSMRLKHETDARGAFELSGTVTPFEADSVSTLSVQLEAFLVSGIVGPELGRLFAGRIDSISTANPNALVLTTGADPGASLSVAFQSALAHPIEPAGFPFLFGLAQTLRDEWFERPVLDGENRGIIRRENGTLHIGNLHLENKDRMAIRGEITMTPDKKLSGKLDIGVSVGMIKTSENKRLDSLFGPPSGGFRWLTLTIGGTAAAPTDNFQTLYKETPILVQSD